MTENADRKFERWRRTGDTDALSDVFDEIAPRLLRLAIHLVGDVAAAEDLVQATFVVAIESARTWDATRPLEPWLTGILDNRAREFIRARRRSLDPAAREDVDHDTPLAHAIDQENSAELVKALDQLGEPYRAAMVLSVLHGMEPAAIAHALNRSPGAVRVQLHRGREALKKILPAGVLACAFLVLTSGRGLAAVKAAVLSHASLSTVVGSAAISGGAFIVKKLVLVLAVIVLLVSGVVLTDRLGTSEQPQPARTSNTLVTPPTGESAQGNALVAESGQGDAREPALATHEAFVVAGHVWNQRSPASGSSRLPAAGSSVLVTLEPYGHDPTVTNAAGLTDEDGAFRIRITKPRGAPFKLTLVGVADDAYCAAQQRTDVSSDKKSLEGVVLTRVTRHTLRGTTLDAHDAPLPGVRLRVQHLGMKQASPIEVVSDQRGMFEVRPEHPIPCYLTAELEDWCFFEATESHPEPDGTWPDVTVVLAPHGVLVVRVLDPIGRPVPDVLVSVQLAPGEQRRTRPRHSLFQPTGCGGRTDADGLVSLDRLWQKKQLSIHVGTSVHGGWIDSMRDGRLVLTNDDGGAPIVIGSDGRLELVARADAAVTLQGRVLLPNAAPAVDAVFEVREADAPWYGEGILIQAGRADADGRFELTVPLRNGPRDLRIAAADRSWRSQPRFGDDEPGVKAAGSIVVDVTTSARVQGIVIRLEPLTSISGSVRLSDGSASWGEVIAVPAGASSPLAIGRLERPTSARIAKDGSFTIGRLLEGRYDLHAHLWDGDSSFVLATQVFTGIESGTKGVELVFDTSLSVRVRVRAVSSYGDVSKLVVLRGRRIERKSPSAAAPAVPLVQVVDSLCDWPLYAPLDLNGSTAENARTHRDTFGLNTHESAEVDVAPMAEGWSVIGVVATLADGRTCFPQATGFVYLGPGQHDITFDVVPVTRLEGRVHGSIGAAYLEVALVDATGGRLPLRSSRPTPTSLVQSLALRDDGWFRIEGAPLGKHRLRIGTRQQLEQGSAAFEREIEILEGGPPIEIDLRR